MGAGQHLSVCHRQWARSYGRRPRRMQPSPRGTWLLGGNMGSRTLTVRCMQEERDTNRVQSKADTKETAGIWTGFGPLPIKPVLHLSQAQSCQKEQSPHRWLHSAVTIQLLPHHLHELQLRYLARTSCVQALHSESGGGRQRSWGQSGCLLKTKLRKGREICQAITNHVREIATLKRLKCVAL